MFGLLAGLIGGAVMRGMAARRPMGGGLGGALSGLMSRRGGGGSPMGGGSPGQSPAQTQSPMQSSSPPPPQQANTAPQAETPPPESRAPQAQPMVNSAPAQMAENNGPLRGLMEDAKPVPAAPKPAGDGPIPTQPIVNLTDSPTPVARPATQEFGATPNTEPSELPDRITSNPPRLTVEMPEANPSKSPDLGRQAYTRDLGYRMSGPASVGSSTMPFRYKRV